MRERVAPLPRNTTALAGVARETRGEESVKKQTFPIGTIVGGKALSIDLPRLVDTRMLIEGNSGGGKSWLIRLMVERAASSVQIIILDPEGEFATLREKVDIALVGQGGEVQTDVRAAALLARRLVEMRISAIVDLYELKLPDRRKYVRLFLESLMNVPRSEWHPLLVVIDEAHLFAPEKSAGESEATGAVIALMSQGRKRGFAGIISTQRLSKLHKDVAAETNNVIIGRTWLDTDQQRAGDLLGMSKSDRAVLRDLEPGEFFAFGPALSANGVSRFRSDTVSTTHPKAGERHLMDVPQASAKIQEIVKQIGDLPKQAEQEARTLAELQQENAKLKREMRARPVQVEQKTETRVERVEVPVLKDGEADKLLAAARLISNQCTDLAGVAGEIRKSVEQATRLRNTPVRAIATVLPRSVPARTQAAPVDSGDTTLRAGERKMLQTLAARYPAKYTRAQLGTLSGFTPRGGTFGTYFGTLKRAGLIVEAANGDVEITQAGLDYLGADVPPQPETTEELMRMWSNALRDGERKMLDTLVRVYPEWVTRADLGETTGFTHTGGTFGTYLGTLRRNGLIEQEADRVRASPTLFA